MSETNGGSDVAAGAAAYTPALLRVYDLGVIYFSNTVLWKCPRRVLLQNYNDHLGRRHLDIGPGTGWYLDHADRPLDSLTLLDLNEHSLTKAASTLQRHAPRCEVANILEPLPSSIEGMASIGATFLYHCVPGDWTHKGRSFAEIGRRLAPGGVFFGASLLAPSPETPGTAASRAVMRAYQRLGVFQNASDTGDGLRAALNDHFARSSVQIVGSAAVFHASQPRGH